MSFGCERVKTVQNTSIRTKVHFSDQEQVVYVIKRREMEIQHLIHEHPLIFNGELKNEGKYIKNFCSGCLEEVSSPSYSCKECNDFILHTSCANSPLKLQHPLHPNHPLILHDSSGIPTKCDGCNLNRCGFAYHCSPCNFHLELKCAFLPLTINTEIHDHPLTLLRKAFLFICEACGKDGNGMSYFCVECSFLVHLECSSHLDSASSFCQMEYKQPKGEFRDEDPIELLGMTKHEDPELNEPTALLAYVVKKTKMREENIEVAVEIKHFSHEHDLKLTNDVETNERCDGCKWAIYPPFYRCSQCKFFLHNYCAQLPRKKKHCCHSHPLTLLSEAPRASRCFRCYACQRLCNGFTYNCEECEYTLDVKCSLISDTIKIDGHEHELILASPSFQSCSACDDFKAIIFRCADCEFTMDFKCATLPLTYKHGQYENPFELHYTVVEDDSGEYSCDLCRKERNPKHWFYYCVDLCLSAHLECVLGEFPLINYGRISKSAVHNHFLTLVQKDGTKCNACGETWTNTDLTFECAKCNFNIHRWCLDKSENHMVTITEEEEEVVP